MVSHPVSKVTMALIFLVLHKNWLNLQSFLNSRNPKETYQIFVHCRTFNGTTYRNMHHILEVFCQQYQASSQKSYRKLNDELVNNCPQSSGSMPQLQAPGLITLQ